MKILKINFAVALLVTMSVIFVDTPTTKQLMNLVSDSYTYTQTKKPNGITIYELRNHGFTASMNATDNYWVGFYPDTNSISVGIKGEVSFLTRMQLTMRKQVNSKLLDVRHSDGATILSVDCSKWVVCKS